MRYKVYGDYGYVTETLLYQSNDQSAAQRWFDGYTDDGDLGGYDIVELAWFSANGEYVVHDRAEAQEEMLYDEF